MFFVRCTTCGKRYSPTMTNCPECGAFNVELEGKIKDKIPEEPEEAFDEGHNHIKPYKNLYDNSVKYKENVSKKVPVNKSKPRSRTKTPLAGVFVVFVVLFITMAIPPIILNAIKDFDISELKFNIQEETPILEPTSIPEYTCPNGFILIGDECVEPRTELEPEPEPRIIPNLKILTSGMWSVVDIYNAEKSEIVSIEEAEIEDIFFFDDMTGYLYAPDGELFVVDWDYDFENEVYSISYGDSLVALAFLDSNILSLQFLNTPYVLMLVQK